MSAAKRKMFMMNDLLAESALPQRRPSDSASSEADLRFSNEIGTGASELRANYKLVKRDKARQCPGCVQCAGGGCRNLRSLLQEGSNKDSHLTSLRLAEKASCRARKVMRRGGPVLVCRCKFTSPAGYAATMEGANEVQENAVSIVGEKSLRQRPGKDATERGAARPRGVRSRARRAPERQEAGADRGYAALWKELDAIERRKRGEGAVSHSTIRRKGLAPKEKLKDPPHWFNEIM